MRASCSRSTADRYFCTRNLLSSSNTCARVKRTLRFGFDFVEKLLISLLGTFKALLAEIKVQIAFFNDSLTRWKRYRADCPLNFVEVMH